MKLLLSDAIALGRVFINKPEPGHYRCCAIGMAVAALKGAQCWSSEAYGLAYKTWPWIAEHTQVPKIAIRHHKYFPHVTYDRVETIISSIFYDVCAGRVTLEQLIDWIRSVEPVETEVKECEVSSEYVSVSS